MVKDLPANAGDSGSIPASGRSLEKEMATHSSIFCLGNRMDRGAWRAIVVQGVAKELDTAERLNNSTNDALRWLHTLSVSLTREDGE